MQITPWMKRWCTCIAGLALLVASTQTLASEPIIAAAADLKFALDEVAQSFKKDTGAVGQTYFRLVGHLRHANPQQRTVPDIPLGR